MKICGSVKVCEKTIDKRRKNIYRKTGVKNYAQFLIYALKKGLEFLR